jgi:hypothetical protein
MAAYCSLSSHIALYTSSLGIAVCLYDGTYYMEANLAD